MTHLEDDFWFETTHILLLLTNDLITAPKELGIATKLQVTRFYIKIMSWSFRVKP